MVDVFLIRLLWWTLRPGWRMYFSFDFSDELLRGDCRYTQLNLTRSPISKTVGLNAGLNHCQAWISATKPMCGLYLPITNKTLLQPFKIWFVVSCLLPCNSVPACSHSLQRSDADFPYCRRLVCVGRVSKKELSRNFSVPFFRLNM